MDGTYAECIKNLHQSQYEALPEELKYHRAYSASELLEKELGGEILSKAEQVFISIYGNQNEVHQVESYKKKQILEQDFSTYLDIIGLSDREEKKLC